MFDIWLRLCKIYGRGVDRVEKIPATGADVRFHDSTGPGSPLDLWALRDNCVAE